MIAERPGLTVAQLSEATALAEAYLYRVLPAILAGGQVLKHVRGLYLSSPPPEVPLVEVPQPVVRELVLGALSERQKQQLLAGDTPEVIDSSSCGPLRPEVRICRREILVRQYTPVAWRSQVAWHTYWDRHGGCGGANLEDEELMAGSPPEPAREHQTGRVSWGQARRWVRGGARPRRCLTRHVARIPPANSARPVAAAGEGVYVVRGSDAGGPAARGPLLRQELPAGLLARSAQGPPRSLLLPAADVVQLVRRADAAGSPAGSAVLRQGVPAGELALQPRAARCTRGGPERHVAERGPPASGADRRLLSTTTTRRSTLIMRIRLTLTTVAVAVMAAAPAFAASTPPPVVVVGHPIVHVTPDRVAEIPFSLTGCATAITCTAPIALYSRTGLRVTQPTSAGFLADGGVTDFPGLRLTPAGWRALRHARRLLTSLVVSVPHVGRELLGYETLLLPAAGQLRWCAGLLRRGAPPCNGPFRSVS